MDEQSGVRLQPAKLGTSRAAGSTWPAFAKRPGAASTDRRGAIGSIALLGLTQLAGRATASLTIDQTPHSMRIDAQGALTDDSLAKPLSSTVISAIRSSGLTAVNITVGEVGNGPSRFAAAMAGAGIAMASCLRHSDLLALVTSYAELEQAAATRRLGIILNLQDTTALEGDLDKLTQLKAFGIRVLQLTYNRRNLAGDGALEKSNAGLSEFGREAILRINEEKLVLDLSHGGQRTIAEAIRASSSPAAITHSGCRDLVDNPRNVYDAEMRALASKGGVFGVYLMPFLRDRGQPTSEDVLKHIIHAVNVCGEDHVGLGTDGGIPATKVDDDFRKAHRAFVEQRLASGIAAPGESTEVYNFVPEYNVPNRFDLIAYGLQRHGWRTSLIEKVLGDNFARLFREVWGS